MENNFYKLDMLLKIPKEKQGSFQSIFSYIKRKLQIKNTRKSHIDSILKKCKGKFFKSVSECIQKCLLVNIKRLPQSFITNITISYNQLFINKTVIELYKHFDLFNGDIESIIAQNQCVPSKKEYFRFLCMSSISDLYAIYLESKIHKREVEYVKQQEGKRFACLYQFTSNNLIFYYLYNKPNKKRKIVNKKEQRFVIVRDDRLDTTDKEINTDIIKNQGRKVDSIKGFSIEI